MVIIIRNLDVRAYQIYIAPKRMREGTGERGKEERKERVREKETEKERKRDSLVKNERIFSYVAILILRLRLIINIDLDCNYHRAVDIPQGFDIH